MCWSRFIHFQESWHTGNAQVCCTQANKQTCVIMWYHVISCVHIWMRHVIRVKESCQVWMSDTNHSFSDLLMKASHWTSDSCEWVVCSCEWVVCLCEYVIYWIQSEYIHIWTSHSLERVVFFFFFSSSFVGLFSYTQVFLRGLLAAHKKTSHVTYSRMHESRRSLEWVMAHRYSYSLHTSKHIMSCIHTWTSHVACMNESCHSYKWVMAHRCCSS